MTCPSPKSRDRLRNPRLGRRGRAWSSRAPLGLDSWKTLNKESLVFGLSFHIARFIATWFLLDFFWSESICTQFFFRFFRHIVPLSLFCGTYQQLGV